MEQHFTAHIVYNPIKLYMHLHVSYRLSCNCVIMYDGALAMVTKYVLCHNGNASCRYDVTVSQGWSYVHIESRYFHMLHISIGFMCKNFPMVSQKL